MARAHGFTLVELLAALCVLGTLATLGVPAALAAVDGMRLSALANTFLAQLHLARSEAIKRNRPVAICKSADGEACADTGGWEQGWIMFHDRDNDGLRDAGEPVLQRGAALPPGIRLVGNLHVARFISFGSTGATRLPGGAFQAGTLLVCRRSAGATQARQIVINAIGRPRIQKVAVASCE